MHEQEYYFSLKSLFLPLTTKKTIWIIVIVSFIVFFYMLFNNFVLDDLTYIQFNTDIHSFNIEKIFGNSFFNDSSYYRPIAALYFTILYLSFDNTTFFYHVFQLAFHITDVVLLFLVFKHFFNRKLSLFLSLIFLVHPIQVESVSYISASDSTIFFLFGIIALLLSLKNEITLRRLMGISGLLLLSLLTKETGFLFLVVIFFYSLLFKRKYLVKFSIAFVIITLLYCFIRFIIGGVFFTKPNAIPISGLTLFERFINVPAIIYYYIKTIFLPLQLVVDQQWIIKTVDFPNFYYPLIIVISFFLFIAAFIFYLRSNRKPISLFMFFLLWFIMGLLITLPFFPIDATVADRWMYFPMAGFLGMLGVILSSIKITKYKIKTVGYISGSLILLFLSLRTMVRDTNWYDPITLYSHDSQIQTNYDLENWRTLEYASMNKYDEAIQHYKKSAALYPYEVTFSNLAHTYRQSDDNNKAKEYYIKTLNAQYISPIHKQVTEDAYEGLADLSVLSNKPNDALLFIETLLRKYPKSGKLWADLAMNEYKLHNQKAALNAAFKAKVLTPDDNINYIYSQILNNQPINLP